MALAGTAWIDFRGNFAGLGSQAAAAGSTAGKSFSSSFKKFAVVAAPAALIAGLGAAVKKAADFEKQMSAVGAVSNATGREMDALSKKALKLGADTSFTAKEAGLAMEELVKAGVSVADVLSGAADATVALAAAGAVDLPTAARIASNAMNAFNLAATDMAGVADTIAGAANASAIDVGEFGMSLSQVGAVANLVGLSFEDTALAITAMGNAGIRGSDAGTSLKTMLNSLQPATLKARKEFRRLGLVTADGSNRFYDAQGNVKSLAEISDVLKDSLAGMTAQQKQASLELLFGSDAIRAAAVVAEEGGAGFRSLAAEVGKISAEDVAEKRLDNLSGSLEKLTGAFDTLLISTGTPLLAPIRAAVDAVTGFLNLLSAPPEEVLRTFGTIRQAWSTLFAGDFVGGGFLAEDSPIANTLIDWHDHLVEVAGVVRGYLNPALEWLSEQVEKVVGYLRPLLVPALAALSAVVAVLVGQAVLGALGWVLGVIGSALGAVAAAVGWPIVAFAALVTGVVLAYRELDGFREGVHRVADAIQGGLRDAWEWLSNVDWAGVWASITDAMRPFGDAAIWLNEEVVQPAWAGIQTAAQAVVDWFQGVDWVGLIGDGWAELQGVWDQVVSGAVIVRDTLKGAWDYLFEVDWLGVWASVASAVDSAADAVGRFIDPLSSPAIAAFRDLWETVTSIDLGGVWDSFTAGLAEVASVDLGGVWETILTVLRPIGDTLSEVWTAVTDLSTALIDLGTAVWDALQPVRESFIPVWTALWPIIKAVGIAVGVVAYVFHRALLGAITLAARALSLFATVTLPAVTWVIENLVAPVLRGLAWWITSVMIPVWQRVWTVVSTVWSAVWQHISFIWGVLSPIFSAIVAFVRDELIGKFNTLATVVSWVWSDIHARISSAWTLVEPIFQAIVEFVDTNLIPVWDRIAGAVSGAFNKIPGIIQGALRLAGNVVAGFLRGAAGIADVIGLDNIASALRDGATKADSWGEGSDGSRLGGNPIGGFAQGGYIQPGWGTPGKDSVPAMLMPGEVVIRKSMVDKYGVRNLLDLNEGRIPGFAAGGAVLLRGASYLMSKGARISEHPMFGGVGGGHARGGYHYSNKSGTGGDAFDANFGPGGQSQAEMAFFDRHAQVLRDMGLRVLWRVANHFNHLHADIGGGGGGIGGAIAGVVDRVGDAIRGIAGGSLERVWPQMDAGKGLLGLIPGGINFLRSSVIDLIKGQAQGMGSAATTAAASGPVRAIVQRLAAARGWTGSQWDALDRLIQKESSWNPNAANPTSSARGLFQKMTSIHGPLEPTIEGQANWGFNYIASRYGSPAAALAFHNRNNWYAKGGLVKPVTMHRNPFDSGGIVRPGLNVIDNKTGKDEVLANVTDGRTAPLIGTVNVNERTDLDVLTQRIAWESRKGAFV